MAALRLVATSPHHPQSEAVTTGEPIHRRENDLESEYGLMEFRPIGEYGIIGNDDRCALVDRHGSIDWCCFPTLASPSVFARILDGERGGHFAVRPTDTYDVRRRYVDRTAAVQTTFESAFR